MLLNYMYLNSGYPKDLRMSLTGVSAVSAGSLLRGCSSAAKVHVFHLEIVGTQKTCACL